MLFAVQLLAVAVVLFVLSVLLFRRPRRLSSMGDKLPGPPALPVIGNALQLGTDNSELYYNLKEMCKKYSGTPFRLWIGDELYVVLTVPQDIEILLRSNTEITKGRFYEFAKPWVGTGLVTSTGDKWRRHRRILTPAFHTKILEQFVDTFYANGVTLVDCLREFVGGPAFNMHHYVTMCALDNICETAMGLKINAQRDAESQYVKAVEGLTNIVMHRSFKPWLQIDLIYKLTSISAQETKLLKVLHDTTAGVIKTRRDELTKQRAVQEGSARAPPAPEDGVKQRQAFLDLLIQSTFEGSDLTDEDIRKEVDTFMFAGHDTTASAIGFALWSLAWNQDIQEAAVEELKEIWPNPQEPLVYSQLQELKYLERVIKESLRLFPSVPIFARRLSEDLVLSGGQVVPKDGNILVANYMTHLDPEIYPEPEKFNPDRFLSENVTGRHPHAYIPFSAGPRNCIGQKFAILEMKCTIAHVLRNYKILPGTAKPDLKLVIKLTLGPVGDVPVSIEARQPQMTQS